MALDANLSGLRIIETGVILFWVTIMRLKGTSQLTILALAIVSLLVASISACACDHDFVEKSLEAPSCHSVEHESREKSVPTGEFDSIGRRCGCVTTSAPVILAKSETKRSRPAVESVGSLAGLDSGLSEHWVAYRAGPRIFLIYNYYKPLSVLRYRPSRAPPRL